jgi:hypothetical protein
MILPDFKYSSESKYLTTGPKSTSTDPSIPYKAPRIKVKIIMRYVIFHKICIINLRQVNLHPHQVNIITTNKQKIAIPINTANNITAAVLPFPLICFCLFIKKLHMTQCYPLHHFLRVLMLI